MKSISTLFATILITTAAFAQTTYNITSNRNWKTNNNSSLTTIPTTCVECTFNIDKGVTLTIDQNVSLQNCTFNGGTISMTSKSMSLQQKNGSGTNYFNGVTLLAYGNSDITGSAPLVITNAVFKLFGTSKFNPQQLFDLTNTKIYLNENSYLTATGGPVNLRNNSQLVAGDGLQNSKAYVMMNGPALNVYDNSSVLLANNNNYYYNWSPYFSGSKNTYHNTSVNTLNCGAAFPNTCRSPYVYGPATINGNGMTGSAILPIVMSEFAANLLNNHTVALTWATQQEVNASRFIVESSADGLVWKSIGSVKAVGNTSLISKYSFTDMNPADGANYYRLKLVDLDESYEYSAVRKVQHTAVQNISVYPNPASSVLHVSVPHAGTNAVVRLVNTTGQILQERTTGGGTISIPVQQYTAGTYFVQITKADGFKQNSVIVINK